MRVRSHYCTLFWSFNKLKKKNTPIPNKIGSYGVKSRGPYAIKESGFARRILCEIPSALQEGKGFYAIRPLILLHLLGHIFC